MTMSEEQLTNEEVILEILKARLSISTGVRDKLLKHIISGIIEELKEQQGIKLDVSKISHQLFVADYAEYRYSSRDNPSMPRHIRWRLNNLMFGILGGGSND